MSKYLDGQCVKCPLCPLIIAVASEPNDPDLETKLALAISEHLRQDHPEYLSPQTSIPAEP